MSPRSPSRLWRRPLRKESDPTWYRIGYSIAAQSLHAAGAGEESVRVEGDDFGQETLSILLRLKAAQSEEGDEAPSFEAAEGEAHRLLQACARALESSGWRWARRTPPWYVRRWKHRRSAGDRKLADFLDSVVEPAALVLMFSARVGQGMPPQLSAREAPGRSVDRRALLHDEPGGDHLDNYLADLIHEDREHRAPLVRLVAWLGLTRLRRPSPVNYRVRYNLACFFSRLAQLYAGDELFRASALEIAAAQLRDCFASLDTRRRRGLAAWARKDPGLFGLRELARREFVEIIDSRTS